MVGDQSPVSVGDKETALENEILRVVVGSGAHGMAIPGTDDRGEMGVYVQPPEQLLGLTPHTEHYVSRTQPEGVRSGPGDTDLTIYALRKFVRLAAAGNPTALVPFWVDPQDVLQATSLGLELRSFGRNHFATRKAGYRFLGYLNGQHERLLGRGRQSHVPNRPELIEKHGYDTKYASHALRLGLQGIELMTEGRLSLPMRAADLERCMEIKTGSASFSQALRQIDATRSDLAALLDGKLPVPNEPDMKAVSKFLVEAHQRHWRESEASAFPAQLVEGRDEA